MLEKVGDILGIIMHGIRTLPFKVAVKKIFPLLYGASMDLRNLQEIVSLKDFVEFTKWNRKEHDMRGFEAHSLLGFNGITNNDIEPHIYPSDEEIEKCEVKIVTLLISLNGM